MPGKLTTHVLDITIGRPAVGMRIDLFRSVGARRTLLRSVKTNSDGRLDEPLLADGRLKRGDYVLLFHVGAYFSARRSPDARRFLDRVPVAFRVADAARHYHVPLLVSPWAYSTYRGS
ncbi:MAG: hydroxyisourate hydrolase [Phycisphaerae bacterium]|nr:hydroxyisourate hydrolase [Phycisphaerae bacterium]MDW8262999.1 hydroxyisourate hydrolase [Phycisphaerales bacterium]